MTLFCVSVPILIVGAFISERYTKARVAMMSSTSQKREFDMAFRKTGMHAFYQIYIACDEKG
jgi:hypothetical protein